MSRSTVRKKKPPAAKAPEPIVEPPRPSRFSHAETWVRERLDWFVWLIVLAGFLLRFHVAGGSYLNSDEAQIMLPPLRQGLAAVYKAGLTFPYGPLNNFLLHFMTFFGGSERYFRMIAILPGALIAFIGYRWASYLFGPAAGVATASILSFSLSMVRISAEVRHYMMHTFWLVCAMYFLERAFGEQSLKWMRLFGASLLLALLTMYMSIWATAAIGLYALLRILNRELPRRLVLEWAMFQVAGAAICAIAYATHLYRLRGSKDEIFARDSWLRGSYYHPNLQSPFDFLHTATNALFGYIFANRALGAWTIAVFVAGVVLILWGKAGVAGKRRLSALSFVLPLIATCGAAMLGLYPFGGTRHDAFLAIFIAVPVAVAISFAAGRKAIIVLLASVFVAPYWYNAGQLNYLEVAPQLQKLEQMKSALNYFAKVTPRPRILVVDEEGGELAEYYICHGKMDNYQQLSASLRTSSCGDYKVLMLREWSVPPAVFDGVLWEAIKISPNGFPDPAWMFSITNGGADGLGPNGRKFGRIVVDRLSPSN